MFELRLYPDQQMLAQATAGHIIQIAKQAIAQKGHFTWALAGGSTPQRAYALLASQGYRDQIDWTRTIVFWGDERCVPPDHPESNFRMANQVLLASVPLPVQNIHRMAGEQDPHQAAHKYEELLRSYFQRDSQMGEMPDGSGRAFSTFDLLLLGLGEDGHTASLFPGSQALAEKQRWVVWLEHRHPPPPLLPRLSITFPAINAAHQVTFIVSGATKSRVLQRVLQESPVDELPASLVNPNSSDLLWLVDQAAASQLD